MHKKMRKTKHLAMRTHAEATGLPVVNDLSSSLIAHIIVSLRKVIHHHCVHSLSLRQVVFFLSRIKANGRLVLYVGIGV